MAVERCGVESPDGVFRCFKDKGHPADVDHGEPITALVWAVWANETPSTDAFGQLIQLRDYMAANGQAEPTTRALDFVIAHLARQVLMPGIPFADSAEQLARLAGWDPEGAAALGFTEVTLRQFYQAKLNADVPTDAVFLPKAALKQVADLAEAVAVFMPETVTSPTFSGNLRQRMTDLRAFLAARVIRIGAAAGVLLLLASVAGAQYLPVKEIRGFWVLPARQAIVLHPDLPNVFRVCDDDALVHCISVGDLRRQLAKVKP